MPFLKPTLVAALIGLGGMTHQAAAGPFTACKADFQADCQGVKPGGGRIKACLKKNADKLSPGCRAAIAQSRKS